LARTPFFEKTGKVSIWLGVRKPSMKAMEGVDILKHLCGVKHYDLDEQEVAAAGDTFPKATVAEILGRLSYSSSFLERANQAAEKKKVNQAYWALAQYEFAYDPARVRGAVAKDPLFLGVFDWNDSEDAESPSPAPRNRRNRKKETS
jgi:hypothetical protein